MTYVAQPRRGHVRVYSSTLHRRLYTSSRLLNDLIAYYDFQCCSDRKGQGNEKSSITEICLTKQHGAGKCVFQIRRLCHRRWTLFRGNSGGFTKPYLSFEQGRGISETRQVCKSRFINILTPQYYPIF